MRLFVAATAVLAMWGGLSLAARADSVPAPPTQWVTDNVGFMSPGARDALNARLQAYEQATGHQVLVWIGDTTGDTPLEDWTIAAFSKWKVGRKNLDDGLVLFVFASDHKVRIEVGYGLEDKVPDAIASRIIRDTIVPLIRSGDRDAAITQGVTAILAAIGGEQPGTEPAPQAETSAHGALANLIGFVIFFMLIMLIFRRFGPFAGFMAYTIGSSRGGFGGGSGFGGGGFGGGGFSGGGGMGGGGGASGGW